MRLKWDSAWVRGAIVDELMEVGDECPGFQNVLNPLQRTFERKGQSTNPSHPLKAHERSVANNQIGNKGEG